MITTDKNISDIPVAAQKVIEQYEYLPIKAEKRIRCPYYRNPRSGRERWGLNAFSGKGSPKEIADEIHMIEKLEGRNFSLMQEEEIRDIMRKRKLGIDCSGFIAHVFDAWLKQINGKRIYQVLRFPHRGAAGRIAAFFRPFTHIDIETLTNEPNAKKFRDVREIRPGDLIRFQYIADRADTNAEIDHALLTTRVEYNENKDPIRIFYAQSVRENNGFGIKNGIIAIREMQNPLEQQEWQEFPDTGHTTLRLGKPELYHPLFLSHP
ncbi:MAG: hypothetical protein HYW95_00525 [Candidatus Wildermuthbacteria bacterium]|nr:hypothetical protein [Candidatus Wildermuthbacteria bacterium]